MRKLFVAGMLVAGLMTSANAQVDPELATESGCFACHRQEVGIIGPSYDDVYEKYKDDEDAEDYLVHKVQNGGAGVWGDIPMAPNFHVDEDDIRLMVEQILHKAE
ncbi:cytochrome C-551 [Ignatzschineria sp. RMDPL8A]|uniref:c-type cytochrome n=1 Tax=Ignatzschineria sp. RMDPL8A TaxID=2999236 RepID=UPI00169A95AD|nr:c-type cytochrome [Ignatzschineria sp. RMDPL8A]MDG9729297.1 cytochrome C-551 [Ignatzschineria sp. RMDPL8A]NLD09321.1 cytochrome C-551 [Xanthomonadaceae bacterium]